MPNLEELLPNFKTASDLYSLAQGWLATVDRNTIVEFARSKSVDKIIEWSGLILLWQFRYFIIRPVVFAFKYVFSESFRELRFTGGKYYLYHKPLMPEIGQQIPTLGQTIRLTRVNITVGIRKSIATQRECIHSKVLGYKGEVDFQNEFIFINASGKLKKYAGNRKYLALYRQAYVERKRRFPFITKSTKETNIGTCGLMVGIAHNHNIYRVSVLMTRKLISYDTAQGILDFIDQNGVTIPTSVQVKALLEAASPADKTELSKYVSPFA